MITNWTLNILLFIAFDKCVAVENKTVGENLFNDLFLSYNKDLLPQQEVNIPVSVNVSFLLMGIRELDEKTGQFSIMASLMLLWNDFRLKWDPSSHNNLTLLVISGNKIWTPNPTLVNPYDDLQLLSGGLFPVTIQYDGVVHWPPGGIMSSVCDVDVTYYPFDVQVCILMFTPWGYPIQSIKFEIQTPVLRYYLTEHGGWDLVNSIIHKDHTNQYISVITVELTLRRRPAFIIFNFILPVIVLLILNCLVFVLPVESGERVSYSVTVLLAIALFLTLVENNLPKTSLRTAMLTYFLLSYVIISATICGFVIFSSSIYYTDDQLNPVPNYMLQIVAYCSRKKVFAPASDNRESPTLNNAASRSAHITWKSVAQWIDRILLRVCLLIVAVSTSVFFLILQSDK